MPTEKTYLIVSGVARSGTTAMGELLNAHPAICLGIERFKFQYLRQNNYSNSLFERDRFFDFREEDTNLDPTKRPAWQPVYDRIAEKWDDARIIGDKVPDMLPILGTFIAENPGYRYICILRNLKDVGLSWQARADKPRDAWPAGKGFVAACESWLEQYQILSGMMRDKAMQQKVLLLDYDSMYTDPALTEAALMGYLGLEPDDGFRAVLQQHAEFFNGRVSRRIPKKFVEPYKALDQTQIRSLRKLSRSQVQAWAKVFYESGRM